MKCKTRHRSFSPAWQARIPIVTAHGEDHVSTATKGVALRYIDTYGRVTEQYPLNPGGSIAGTAGLSSDDGRSLIVMPHPERMFLGLQHSWTRELQRSRGNACSTTPASGLDKERIMSASVDCNPPV